MSFNLSRRNKALITVPLFSTYGGTASLLSSDGHDVKVPLAPLLGASTQVRSVVAESHLHPSIHGPLTLSFEVSAAVLGNVANMFLVGESEVKEENIKEVIEVLDSLGVKANLGLIVYEHTDINEEDIQLEKVSDKDSDLSEGNENKIEAKVEAKLSSSSNNMQYGHIASNEENVNLEIVFEPASGKETDLSDGDVREAKNNSMRECYVNIEKLGARYDLSYRTSKNVTGKTGKKCNICNYSAKCLSSLRIHMRSHTGEKPYKCSFCNYCCSKASSLKVHTRIHTGEKPYKCEICNYSCSYPGSLKNHRRRIHEKKKLYKCKICKYSGSDPIYFKVHCRIHTGEKPYVCEICNYSCSDPSSQRKHRKRIHEKKKLYKCKICKYSCSDPRSLRKHSRIHEEEKLYKCKICKYSCSDPSNLKVHQRIHTGKRPYSCKICNKSFSLNHHLRRHARIHTVEKNHDVKM